MPSLTIENYVKAIYVICKSRQSESAGGQASTGEIAQRLNVSPGSVTSMLKTLSDSGLARYTPYEGAELTAAGQTLALRVLRRHRLIELFLVETLKFDWDQVHEEAENLEHAVSDLVVDRLDEFLRFPVTDPHGDPIPRTDGTMPVANQDLKSLRDLVEGDSFRVQRVCDQSTDFLRYLTDASLLIGTRGRVRSNCESSGVLEIEHGDQQTTISREIAGKLQVELVTEVA